MMAIMRTAKQSADVLGTLIVASDFFADTVDHISFIKDSISSIFFI